MNSRAIRAIIHKDVKVVSQNKMVLAPIIIIVFVFFAALPWGVALVPALIESNPAGVTDIPQLLEKLPANIQQEMAGMSTAQQATYYILLYMLAPMFLLVPLMVAATFAADSFAGS